MLVTAIKLLTCCIKMCDNAVFRLYFLMIFLTVKKWWTLMKQLNAAVWICNIETVLCTKMIMTMMKIWNYCLSIVNCVTENEENMILIEVKFVSQLLAVELQEIVEFVCHCEQDRVLLRLTMKHVKTCAQWIIVDIWRKHLKELLDWWIESKKLGIASVVCVWMLE